MTAAICTGCDRPIWDAHATIEEHVACESAQQNAVRAELERAAAALPKKDGRFLSRNAPTLRAHVSTATRGGGRRIMDRTGTRGNLCGARLTDRDFTTQDARRLTPQQVIDFNVCPACLEVLRTHQKETR